MCSFFELSKLSFLHLGPVSGEGRNSSFTFGASLSCHAAPIFRGLPWGTRRLRVRPARWRTPTTVTVQLEASVSDTIFILWVLVVFSVALIQVPLGRIGAHVGCRLGGCVGHIAEES